METYVCDTHTLFWHLTSSPRLGAGARRVLQRADRGEALVVVPAIVWYELYYLNQKQGTPLNVLAELNLITESAGYLCPTLDPGGIAEFEVLSAVPEMHDRMIAAVAYTLGAPCLTRDTAIAAGGLIRCLFNEPQ